MKFISVAAVTVLFVAVTVSAAPSVDAEKPIGNHINDVRELIKCVDGAFDVVGERYKELEKYHFEYKAKSKDINLKLDECEKIENSVSKNECVSLAMEAFEALLNDLSNKLKQEKEEIVANLAFLIMAQCG